MWVPVPPSYHFVQCMAFDNQIEAPADVLARILRVYSLFFETIVLNRAFVLNDPDLRQLFKDRGTNGLVELINAGGITFIKSGLTLEQDWANAMSDGKAGATRDGDYVKSLSDALEGGDIRARFVTYDLTDTTRLFFEGISDIWAGLGRLRDFVLPEDGARMDAHFAPGSDVPPNFLRGSLLLPADAAHPWALDIPVRHAEEQNLDLIRMIQLLPRQAPALDDRDRGLLSKLILKQIIDYAYNANLPRQHGMSLGFHRVWSDVRSGLTTPRNKLSTVVPELRERSRIVTMVDFRALPNPSDTLGFRSVAAMLGSPDLSPLRADLARAVAVMATSPSEVGRHQGMQATLDALADIGAWTAGWAVRHDPPLRTVEVRIAADSRQYRTVDPLGDRVRFGVDIVSIASGLLIEEEPLIEFELPIAHTPAGQMSEVAGDRTSERMGDA